MGNNQSHLSCSTYARRTTIHALSITKHKINPSNKSQHYLLSYLHLYIKSTSSPAYHILLYPFLRKKLRKYVKCAIKSNLANGRDAFFGVQADDDFMILAGFLRDLYLGVGEAKKESEMAGLDRIFGAVRRREVLGLAEFSAGVKGELEKIKGKDKEKVVDREGRDELEFSVLHGPVGGYASLSKEVEKEIPWWEKAANGTVCGNSSQLKRSRTVPVRRQNSTTYSYSRGNTITRKANTTRQKRQPRVMSIASSVLSTRDWESGEKSSSPAPPSYEKVAKDCDSWTSSIHTEEETEGAGDVLSRGETRIRPELVTGGTFTSFTTTLETVEPSTMTTPETTTASMRIPSISTQATTPLSSSTTASMRIPSISTQATTPTRPTPTPRASWLSKDTGNSCPPFTPTPTLKRKTGSIPSTARNSSSFETAVSSSSGYFSAADLEDFTSKQDRDGDKETEEIIGLYSNAKAGSQSQFQEEAESESELKSEAESGSRNRLLYKSKHDSKIDCNTKPNTTSSPQSMEYEQF